MAEKKTRNPDRFRMGDDDRAVIKKLEMLTQAVEKIYPDAKHLMWRSFLQGLFVSIGATIGFSLLIAIITFTLTQLKVIPGMKDIINQTQIEKVIDTTK